MRKVKVEIKGLERDRGNKKGEGKGIGRDKKQDKYEWDNKGVVRVWVIIRVIRREDGVRVE